MKEVKSEEQIYIEIINYINGKKHNRPCTLSTIKKKYRSKRIINLIFSNPDIFKLKSEIKHVPIEYLTDEILIKYVLAHPKEFEQLDESLQTIPVMVAFEFAKRRFEYISSIYWGASGEKIKITEKYSEYRNSLSSICNKLTTKYNDKDILENYSYYVEKISNEIITYCNKENIILEKQEKYISRYTLVDFNIDKPIFILVSGLPDSGKTTVSNILSNKIKDSIYFDSDMLLERNMLTTPLSQLINNAKVIIFSDIYADRFFSKDELGDSLIINILVRPISIEMMHRYSKYMYGIPFNTYKKNEIETINYTHIDNYINITNDYTNNLLKEVDIALEEIEVIINNYKSNNSYSVKIL